MPLMCRREIQNGTLYVLASDDCTTLGQLEEGETSFDKQTQRLSTLLNETSLDKTSFEETYFTESLFVNLPKFRFDEFD